MLEIREHSSPTYPPRTYQNAKEAHLTVAFAVDFQSAGERLTHKAAGDRYLSIGLDIDAVSAARILFRELRSRNATVLNVAGNGIYSLAVAGWTQERLNEHFYTVLAAVHQHWPLQKVISGGQTGVDIAGITAAHALHIHAVATLPKGFLQRGLSRKDEFQTEASVRHQVELGALALREMHAHQTIENPVGSGPNEADARVEALPRLQQHAGAVYTLYQVASKALQGASGDAQAVNWEQVHQDVFTKAVGANGQPVAAVLEAIRKHSPGAVTPEQIAAIEALGEPRKMGRMTNLTMIALPERFQKWFGESVVTKDGAPRIAYHGTSANFTQFELTDGVELRGAFFSEDVDEAKEWAGLHGGQDIRVIAVYLRIERQADYGDIREIIARFEKSGREKPTSKQVTDALKRAGFDGYIDDRGGYDEYVVFSPSQVVLASEIHSPEHLAESNTRAKPEGMRP